MEEFVIKVGSGKTEEREGKSLKRFGYPAKVGRKIAEKVESGVNVKLMAIGPEAVNNACKAFAHAQAELMLVRKNCVIKEIHFEQVTLKREDKETKTRATVFKVSPTE